MKKIMLCSLLLVFLVLAGCVNNETETGTNTGDNDTGLDSEDTINNANVNLKTYVWPADMPAVVPEFTYGDIVGISPMGDSWIIHYINIQDTDPANYLIELEAMGWEISSLADAYHGEYGSEYTVSLIHNKESNALQMIMSSDGSAN